MPALIPALFLAATALIALAPLALARSLPDRRARRAFAAAWVTWIMLWGAAAVAVATGRVTFDPPVLRLGVLFGGQIALGVLLFLALPPVRTAVRAVPLVWLVGWQRARIVGGFFILGALAGVVSWPFALIAGTGDVAVGIAAHTACRRMHAAPDRAVALAVRHARTGLTDFAVAISVAIMTGAEIGWPYSMIPLFLVPMAVLGHLATLDRLPEASRRP